MFGRIGQTFLDDPVHIDVDLVRQARAVALQVQMAKGLAVGGVPVVHQLLQGWRQAQLVQRGRAQAAHQPPGHAVHLLGGLLDDSGGIHCRRAAGRAGLFHGGRHRFDGAQGLPQLIVQFPG